ncbi:MAG: hypothetical protein UY31_C0075G0005 [Candidatus Wolfebacteria bacterium GW2011_GWE1_48_7]|nr:MAG: hypothetical protein UY31_C0075G0005 [Candidatus Wolfebacteria bacterium GW2011_GWE1_48_7]
MYAYSIRHVTAIFQNSVYSTNAYFGQKISVIAGDTICHHIHPSRFLEKDMRAKTYTIVAEHSYHPVLRHGIQSFCTRDVTL